MARCRRWTSREVLQRITVSTALLLTGCGLHHESGAREADGATLCPRMLELGRVSPSDRGRVAGEVYSGARLPMNQAQVEITSADGGIKRGTVTDRNGVFRVDSLATGKATVTVRSIGHDTQVHEVTVVTVAPTVVCAIMQETRVPLSHDGGVQW